MLVSPVIFGLIFGSVPVVLIAVATKNRKVWLWWYRTKWKGSIILSLANMASKGLAFVVGYSMASHGTGSSDVFAAVVGILNFPDLVTLELLSRFTLQFSSVVTRDLIPWPIYVAFDFLLVYIGFSLLWSCKAYFARKAYEVE